MTKRFQALAAAVFTLATVAVPGGFAQAQDIKDRTFKLAFLPTEQHPSARYFRTPPAKRGTTSVGCRASRTLPN